MFLKCFVDGKRKKKLKMVKNDNVSCYRLVEFFSPLYGKCFHLLLSLLALYFDVEMERIENRRLEEQWLLAA